MINFFKKILRKEQDFEDDVLALMSTKHTAHIMSASNVEISGNELLKRINTAITYGYRLGIEKGLLIGVLFGGVVGYLI